MSIVPTHLAVDRRSSPTRPHASWSDLLAQVGRHGRDYRHVAVPPARDWRDLVADLIAGRR